MAISFTGYNFVHAFTFIIKIDGKEKKFNIMITEEQEKNSLVRYVGLCIDKGIAIRSEERNRVKAMFDIIRRIVQISVDFDRYRIKNFPNMDIEYAGALQDEAKRNQFNEITKSARSFFYYQLVRSKIERGDYLFERTLIRDSKIKKILLQFEYLKPIMLWTKERILAIQKNIDSWVLGTKTEWSGYFSHNMYQLFDMKMTRQAFQDLCAVSRDIPEIVEKLMRACLPEDISSENIRYTYMKVQ